MKIYKRNKILTFTLALLFFLSLFACIPVKNFTIANGNGGLPEQINETFTEEVSPFTISENKTIELNGVTIEGTDDNPTPITIEPGCTVNIILSGENTLTAKSDKLSAGIYVKRNTSDPENPINATLNIYGREEGKLIVTGGKYGAGIGGIGTENHIAPYNQGTPGVINIKSGNVIAQGGNGGAGIGSGRSASGNEINISGGNIVALAGSSGAGIGSGYGTSGGKKDEPYKYPKVGDFDGGIINITGGNVKAAAGKFKQKENGTHYSFDDFDIYNTDFFFENCYDSNGYGAGIGGGYGASSGQIVIGGNADVTAIGSCGGAGIGSGRGSSKSGQYHPDPVTDETSSVYPSYLDYLEFADETIIPVNITIKDNAKVVAAAPDDTRNNQGGGAGIGGGRGFNDGGIIKILDNANVTAIASPYAAAIGGSWKVGSIDIQDPTLIAKPDVLEIAETAIVSTASDGFVSAINTPTGDNSSLMPLSISEDFINNNSDVLNNEELIKFPLTVEVQDLENADNKANIAINNKNKSFWVNLPCEKCSLKLLGENSEESIYLSNSVEDNSATFYTSKSYDITGLTSPIEQEVTVKNGEENLKIKIRGQEGIFEYGANFHAESINDENKVNEFNTQLDEEYKNKLERIQYFDIGVSYRQERNDDGTAKEYDEFSGGLVSISIQVPSGWDKEELLAIYIKNSDDESFNHRLETIDGVDYITFETTHFSNYALFDPDVEKEGTPTSASDTDNIPTFPSTGDAINALIHELLLMAFKSFSTIFIFYGKI